MIPALSPESQQLPEAQPTFETELVQLGNLFDEVSHLGNSLHIPQTVDVKLPEGYASVSCFPQRNEHALSAYLLLNCYDSVGEHAGKIFLAGDRGHFGLVGWKWGLTSRPGVVAEPSAEAKELALQYMVPMAAAWSELGEKAQDAQIETFRASIQGRKQRRIAQGLKRLRTA